MRESITDSLLSTQLFLATAALTSLVLAAVTAERATAAAALRANEERLQSVVRSHGRGADRPRRTAASSPSATRSRSGSSG